MGLVRGCGCFTTLHPCSSTHRSPTTNRAQKVSLTFHFIVEQRARSFLRTFFGFNGTGGVWRRKAMEAGGRWNEDSTVEDMDLSIRAYLHGWKFRYLDWVHCPNELPPTLSAYKTQQFRWNR